MELFNNSQSQFLHFNLITLKVGRERPPPLAKQLRPHNTHCFLMPNKVPARLEDVLPA